MTAKRYVNCIVRKIKCSKKERLEIKNQLHSDIAIAMEQGEAFEDIMNRMGSVSEVAAEFNSNLSKAEQKKYKRVVAWKIVLVTVAAVIGILGVFAWWCLPKVYEFGTSGLYDEDTVEIKAKQVIQLFDARDYEAMREMSDAVMKSVTTEENMELARQTISDDWGDFESFGSVYMVEMEQRNLKGVMVQVSTLYENVGVNYVISFDEDMKLVGFYMR